jgi:hypothetical protein
MQMTLLLYDIKTTEMINNTIQKIKFPYLYRAKKDDQDIPDFKNMIETFKT